VKGRLPNTSEGPIATVSSTSSRYFGIDFADPHQYHIVINSSKVGYREAAQIIVEAASRHGAEPIEGTGKL
jgi:hypothetical protein